MKRWAWFVALGLGLCGCDSGEIVIFSPAQAGAAGSSGLPGGGAGGAPAGAAGALPGGSGGSSGIGDGGSTTGGGGAMNPTCLSTADCDVNSNAFCSKQSCADAQGVCVPRPFPDETTSDPVCDCDGRITFWNDSFRQLFGVSASTPGVCSPDPKYGCTRDCGPDQNIRCAHQLTTDAACDDQPSPGQCWVMPRNCSKAEPQHNLICPPPGSGLPPQCATTCQAIKSQLPFTQLPTGQTCQ
ncbi:MAG TPA: PAS domain-containing protein [Polyangiaceae bacterium]|nr:PAS domain-containing protein [Polyangiaceae bacterium]